LERAGFETVAFCEIEKYPCKILKKHWPEVPIFNDVRSLDLEGLKNAKIKSVDVVCGGFPCQPFSVAGKQGGKEDNRHLWPEMFRIIKETKPSWVIGENVAGFINMALDDVLFDLESEGYETQSFVIPACSIGGIHRRDRVWIVANSYDSRWSARGHHVKKGQILSDKKRKLEENKQAGNGWKCGTSSNGNPSNLANSFSARLQGSFRDRQAGEKRQSFRYSSKQGDFRRFRRDQTEPIRIPVEPPVCHRDDGISNRLARLKALGNAVVPQIPEIIGRYIMEIENGS